MEARFSYDKAAAGVYKAMIGVEQYLENCGLEESLLHLIRLRAFPDQRLRLLSGYALERSARNRRTGAAAVLVGRLARMPLLYRTRTRRSGVDGGRHAHNERHVPDTVSEEAHPHFSDKELSDLTFAVTAINTWNRLSIASRTVPGTYRPAKTYPLGKGA
jgi:hypothetical protein